MIFVGTFTGILIILGNALVLVVTWKKKSLHQPNKYFVAGLAAADLLVGAFVAPVLVLSHFKINERNVHLCRFLVWISIFSLVTSIYTLTFISFDRYLKISKPLQYRTRMRTSTSLKIICFIWIISAVIASYAAAPNSGSNGLTKGLDCFTMKSSTYIAFSVISIFLPIIFMAVMYCLIFHVVHKRRQMLQNGELGQANSQLRHRNGFFQDLKVIRMFLVVVGVFMLCWIPIVVRLFDMLNNPDVYDPKQEDSTSSWHRHVITNYVIEVLPLVNSLCNPFIYACLDQTYKIAFKNMFRGMIWGQSTRGELQQKRNKIANKCNHGNLIIEKTELCSSDSRKTDIESMF
ncbi:beta-2 adrenergic receptor-like [Dendronephthya gigantea]|uniref:beta-2 adrenergic receptor-like n=1 Tax=Dendronephthya gigantea TaxID=151771 RepID=UPI00106A6CBE|nr:beta-2 adrenergic receptor-like [Dendronephthya gigantea]